MAKRGRKPGAAKKAEVAVVAKETSIALVEEQNVPAMVDPQALIARAIDKNLPIESMERLLAMRRELRAEWARDQYFAALARFQKQCPIIGKSMTVRNKPEKGGGVRYKYAPLDVIIGEVKNVLEANGFSYTLATEQTADSVTAICNAHHIAGHTESARLTVPIDHEAYMTEPQKVASALTYASRYAFRNVFGIMTGDEDDDAISAGEPKPTKPMKEPQAVDATFRAEPAKEKSTVELAREALSILYKRMVASNHFDKEELNERKEQGIKAKDDLNSLIDLHASWTNELKERNPK